MRYNSQVAVEHQGLRDVERWKDKIEVRLDNRQVAFLFFGSALCACMLFILGVIVGKRLESRGRAMAPEIEDPLALLDRVAASTPPLAAPTTAPSEPAPVARVRRPEKAEKPAVEKAVAEKAVVEKAIVDKPAADKVIAEKPAAEKLAAPTEKKLPEKPVEKPVVAAVKPPAAQPPPPVAAKAAQPRAVAALDPEPASPPPAPTQAAPAWNAPPAAVEPAVPSGAARGKPRFMLQVGSFPMRAEADAFAATFAGQNSVVIPWDVPGKGLWYRVRIGNFQTFKEAIDAKLAFEKKHNKIALVVGPL